MRFRYRSDTYFRSSAYFLGFESSRPEAFLFSDYDSNECERVRDVGCTYLDQSQDRQSSVGEVSLHPMRIYFCHCDSLSGHQVTNSSP